VADTLRRGKATFYSRSRSALWTKGETSNNFIQVQSLAASPHCLLGAYLQAFATPPPPHLETTLLRGWPHRCALCTWTVIATRSST
jgi:hypothetical protein